ncbi:MAG TPA: IS1182 family transposase [Candidatus Saccharimonadales bacterium]|nr:IS1182 family transposase [Candidatus Saccharimonadales bacterium]
MPTTFLPYEPDQTFLLPPSPSEWLPENHLVYFVSDIIDRLDLQKFYSRYEGDGRRNQPYDPAMLVKVLVYGYATGVFSSRKQAKKLYEDVAFRLLGAGNFPSHRTICDFRMRHLPELKELFVAVARLAKELGLVKLGTVALDGTKVKAHASKHKAMSYGRMKEQEQKLTQEIEALLERARATDAQEDARWGGDQGEEELPKELQRRQDRLAKIQAAKARVEERQAQADRERGRHPEDGQRRGDGAGRPFKQPFGVPQDKAQDNFTDPESRIMKLGGSFEQCYNAQAVVDADSQLIVASGLGNNAADNEELVPMVEAVKDNLGELPKRALADSGFRSEDSFAKLEKYKEEMEVLVALGREGKDQAAIDPKEYPATVRMAERLARKEGQAHYRRRKAIVEPVFGWIKHAIGFRQFSLRGLNKVTGEWGLVCLALNLRRMWVLQS